MVLNFLVVVYYFRWELTHWSSIPLWSLIILAKIGSTGRLFIKVVNYFLKKIAFWSFIQTGLLFASLEYIEVVGFLMVYSF